MSLFSISGLLVLVSSLFFGFFVFIKDYKNKANQVWGFFSISVAFWGIASLKLGLISENNKELALFWWRITYLGIIFIPVFYYHYVHLWLGLKNKTYLFFLYLWGAFFFLIQWSPWANLFFGLNTLTYVFNTAYIATSATPLYLFFILSWYGFSAYTHFLLYIKSKKAPQEQKKQISFFYIATAIGFIGGGATFLFPFRLTYYPLLMLNFLVPLYPAIMAYAILKHHLMNIRVIATELFAFGIITFSFVQVFLVESLQDIIIRSVYFLGVAIFGILLIRSVLQEVKRREQLQDLTDRLEIANVKLKALDEAKSEFISIASHQLRTPLSFIKGNISMALEEIWGKLKPDQERELEKVYVSNERLIKLVDDLLDISRIENNRMEFKYESLSLEKMVEDVTKEFTIKAKVKKLFLLFKKPTKALSKVKIDSLKIRQVIMNMIDNAIKYTEDGGVTVSLEERDNMIRVMVTDTGLGVSDSQQKLLFQKFSRAKEVTKIHTEGMGLGLYLAAHLIKAHKGNIGVVSRGQGEGSTFWFELPVEK